MIAKNKPELLKINRQVLSDGTLQKLASERIGKNAKLLSDRELLASRRSVIKDSHSGKNIWIFGYGSLIWNPCFDFDMRIPAHLFGYHRRFCLSTTITRGSPENPGLVLGLDRGGSTKGILFRIPASIATKECDVIWKREMLNGAYEPTWVRAKIRDKKNLKALTFVIKRSHPSFVAPMSDEESATIIAEASGILGSNAEYLFNTEEALKHEGIYDYRLQKVSGLVKAYQKS